MSYKVRCTESNKKTYNHSEIFRTVDDALTAASSFCTELPLEGAHLELVDILDNRGAVIETFAADFLIALKKGPKE